LLKITTTNHDQIGRSDNSSLQRRSKRNGMSLAGTSVNTADSPA
jgi:hypothetical protein